MNDNTTKQTLQKEDFVKLSVDDKLINIFEKLINHDARFDMIDNDFKEIRQEIRESEGRLSSRMRELEKDVRDISSITHAVRRMNVGFQEIPYEMNGRSAVEQIKDYY